MPKKYYYLDNEIIIEFIQYQNRKPYNFINYKDKIYYNYVERQINIKQKEDTYDILIAEYNLFNYNDKAFIIYYYKGKNFKNKSLSRFINLLIKYATLYSDNFFILKPNQTLSNYLEELERNIIRKYLEKNINKFKIIPDLMKIVISYI